MYLWSRVTASSALSAHFFRSPPGGVKLASKSVALPAFIAFTAGRAEHVAQQQQQPPGAACEAGAAAMPLVAVEFYCGIGGLHYSLQARLARGATQPPAPAEARAAPRSARGRTTRLWLRPTT